MGFGACMGKETEPKQMRRSRRIATADIAVGGLFEALSLGMLFLASILPNMELTMPALAGILVYLMCRRSGFVPGAVFFAAGVLLALAMIPGKIALLPYFFCFGPYALLKTVLDGPDGPWLFIRKRTVQRDSGSGMGASFGIRLSDEPEPGTGDKWENGRNEPSDATHMRGQGAAPGKTSRTRRAVSILLRYVLKLMVFATLTGIGILLFKTLFIENLALPDIAVPLLAVGAVGLFLMYDYILGLAQAMLGKYIRNR